MKKISDNTDLGFRQYLSTFTAYLGRFEYPKLYSVDVRIS